MTKFQKIANFAWVLSGIFIGLRLTHIIEWPWYWLLAPLWILALIYVAAILFIMLVGWALK